MPMRHVSRRHVLQAAAALGLAAGGAQACGRPAPGEASREGASAPVASTKPRSAAEGAGSVAAGDEPGAPFAELAELTCAQLQTRMAAGDVSSAALVDGYLARISALDGVGPQLRAIIELNPDARALARALDDERARSGARGPLHGIPILLKDNIDTADGMSTTAGSLALAGSHPTRDATVAARLREAGAVLIGKANMSEWANFRSTASTSGWSARGGQCRNPYALDRSPSGSSSGSAVAAAANLAAAAIGTETDGSIVSPASHCALVGVKPTVGLVSRAGIVPIAHSQDTAGPLTRTVADAAVLLQTIASADARDPLSRHGAERDSHDFVAALSEDGLRGVRLGVVRAGLFGKSAKVDGVIETALDDLRRLGAILVDPANIATWGDFDDSELEVLLYEFKTDLAAYLATRGAGLSVKNLADLMAFNKAHASDELRHFGQELFEMAARKGPLTDQVYRRALSRNRRLAAVEGIDATLRAYRVDALVGPTGSLPALIDLVNGDSGYFGAATPAAVAGYPHVTVPAGFVRGLPVGLSFFGAAWSDGALLRYAFAYEQGTQHRRPPRFLRTADLS